MHRRSLVGALIGGLAMPVATHSASLAANRNTISRGLNIPGIDTCLYTRSEPRRKPAASLPWLDAWLIETDDEDTIDLIPAAFATAYSDALTDSRTRILTGIQDVDLETFGDDSWAAEGTYIDPDADAELGIWAALHIRFGDAVVTLCAESEASPITDLETIATAILARKQNATSALLPVSADLPDGMRIVDRAIEMHLGDS